MVRTIDVGEGPTFPVAIDSTSGPVQAGESLAVSVTVRNTGDTTETTPIKLSAVNELQAQQRVELAPGETEKVYLAWQTTMNDAGVQTIEVASADASAESRERISPPAEVVSTDAANESTVNEEENTGSNLNEVENTGLLKIIDPGFVVVAALVALLAVALLGYGLRRN